MAQNNRLRLRIRNVIKLRSRWTIMYKNKTILLILLSLDFSKQFKHNSVCKLNSLLEVQESPQFAKRRFQQNVVSDVHSLVRVKTHWRPCRINHISTKYTTFSFTLRVVWFSVWLIGLCGGARCVYLIAR